MSLEAPRVAGGELLPEVFVEHDEHDKHHVADLLAAGTACCRLRGFSRSAGAAGA